jgi:hypothetical protein
MDRCVLCRSASLTYTLIDQESVTLIQSNLVFQSMYSNKVSVYNIITDSRVFELQLKSRLSEVKDDIIGILNSMQNSIYNEAVDVQ